MGVGVKRNVLILAAALLALPAWAQRQDLLSRSELLLTGGGMFYIGDLNDQSALTLPQAAASAGWRVRLDNRWALRLQGSYGKVGSDDRNELRNLNFESKIIEASLVGEFNFAPYGPGQTERNWTPYIFGGLALFHYNPMTNYTQADGTVRWVELQPLRTEGQGTAGYPGRKVYRLTQLSLPFGVGVKWRLGKTISLSAEYGFRKTWTDYLDDVSTTYVGSSYLVQNVDGGGTAAIVADRSGEVVPGYENAPGIKRGDDSLDDWYAYLNVTVGISLETLLGWMRSKRCRN